MTATSGTRRLVRPSPVPPCEVQCCACVRGDEPRKWYPIGEVWADLDGEPFVAYYCAKHRPG